MANYDRVLVGPGKEELEGALAEVIAQANRNCRRQLGWPLEGWPAVAQEFDLRPEGWRQWQGGEMSLHPEPRAVVGLAWWTDFLGQRHFRVAGLRLRSTGVGSTTVPLSPRGEALPPVALVYPDHVAVRRRPGGEVPIGLCRCGAFGRPAEVGWKGDRCGPCHDRREEGGPPRQALPPSRKLYARKGTHYLAFLAFAPDGGTVAVGDGSQVVAVWDSATLELRQTLAGRGQDRLLSAGILPGGTALVTGAAGGLISCWDVTTGRAVGSFPTSGSVDALAASPDGRRLAKGNPRGITVWETDTGRMVCDLRGEIRGTCHRLAFAPAGETLACTTTWGGGVYLWDTSCWQARHAPRLPEAQAPQLAFAPDGRTLAVSWRPSASRLPSPGEAQITLLDVGSGVSRPGHALPGPDPCCLAFAPDGGLLVGGGADGLVQVLDPTTGAERTAWAWHQAPVLGAAFVGDGRALLTIDSGGRARLWPRELLDRP
jgi:hypothetical protein